MLTVALGDFSEYSEGRCKPTAEFKVRVDTRQNFQLQDSFLLLDIGFSERKKGRHILANNNSTQQN